MPPGVARTTYPTLAIFSTLVTKNTAMAMETSSTSCSNVPPVCTNKGHITSASALEQEAHDTIFNALRSNERAMAFYAGVWRKGRWQIPLEEAKSYAESLPEAIAREHDRIEAGARPPFPKLTAKYVKELVSNNRAVAQGCAV